MSACVRDAVWKAVQLSRIEMNIDSRLARRTHSFSQFVFSWCLGYLEHVHCGSISRGTGKEATAGGQRTVPSACQIRSNVLHISTHEIERFHCPTLGLQSLGPYRAGTQQRSVERASVALADSVPPGRRRGLQLIFRHAAGKARKSRTRGHG